MGVDAGERGCFEITLHPRVPMPYVQAAAPLAALAICEQVGEGARVLWPSSVVVDGREIARVTARAGYDEGMFVRLFVEFDARCASEALLASAVRERADAWERDVAAGRSAAGPFAPFAGDFFDCMAGMGDMVELVRRDGRALCRARLEGIDMWGRISVRMEDGQTAELAPEQVSVRLLEDGAREDGE